MAAFVVRIRKLTLFILLVICDLLSEHLFFFFLFNILSQDTVTPSPPKKKERMFLFCISVDCFLFLPFCFVFFSYFVGSQGVGCWFGGGVVITLCT